MRLHRFSEQLNRLSPPAAETNNPNTVRFDRSLTHTGWPGPKKNSKMTCTTPPPRSELQDPTEVSHSLCYPLFVLDESESDVALTPRPKPTSWRSRHLRFGDEELREPE